MLQKFALAFKTKTIEFFAEEGEQAGDRNGSVEASQEIINGRRVVVIKTDRPNKPTCNHHHLRQDLVVSSLFAALSSFHAAYLQLQSAHEPFSRETIESADQAAVSHLRRLSALKNAFFKPPNLPNSLPLLPELEAEVEENQSTLRKFETVFNRLQSDIDRKDAEVSYLKRELKKIESLNSVMERRLARLSSVKEEKTFAFLSIRSFDSVLKECFRTSHGFAKALISLMRSSGWDLEMAANSIYPNVDYAKRGHCRYAILSYICLGMFGGFASIGEEKNFVESKTQREIFRSHLVEHLRVDPLELMSTKPDCEVAKFCENKYRELIHPDMESSLLGRLDWRDHPLLRSWHSSNPIYEPFVAMCSNIWMLQKLKLAFDRPVEIFQVGQGMEFSMVYMEDVVPKAGSTLSCDANSRRQKVGFTVVPGFRIGKMAIQCRVYLNYVKSPL